MAIEQFNSKYTADEIEAMLDKVHQDMAVIEYTQSQIAALLDKIDNLTVPTNVSDLNNDSGFVTSTANNLLNYYLATETYTKTEIDTKIDTAINGRFIRPESGELPTTDIDVNAIYLIPSSTPKTDNVYDEYINTDGTSNGWEFIGSTRINLDDYVTNTALGTTLNDYVTTTALGTALQDYVQNSVLSDYYTKTEVDNLIAAINSGNEEPNGEETGGGETPGEGGETGGGEEPSGEEPSGEDPNNEEPNSEEP